MGVKGLRGQDGAAAGLAAAGVLCVATGLLDVGAAEAALVRLAPLLAFLASVIVLAELTGAAGVFDAVAAGVARAARGRYAVLFVLCSVFVSVTTIALNLDTTAVLLTPVMLALAGRVGVAALPPAMTTIWLANTASLLLPVSNLTNLLAADRLGLSPQGMAVLMWAPQLAAVAVTMLCLWVFYWRPARPEGGVLASPEPFRVADRVLFAVSAVATAGFLAAILGAEVPLWAASGAAALVVVGAFAVRRPGVLRPSLVPWRLLVLVPGLFLVVETVTVHGLHGWLVAAMGADGGVVGMFRSAAVGAGLSNVLNNLPVYLAGEGAVPVDQPQRLAALLIGTNVGALVVPWASLATLLCLERCRRHGTRVPAGRFVVTGLVLSVAATAAATGALALGR
ncbi:ArsB/NhaD family transporter [Streptomyces sp. DSM 42041]|uniref:ArsB/NhaD family transporter n=1 Tax=Streptomyces hazeniae TaxID=3075538 RepID=A0ABU2NSK5_9ACTN|nr:SLC13 family permease [Streptomyces sp. DSM 42041]MDT0379959.1 ArsB/NhaD family transporter [Streptomyces sp. DSM 42041]